jgi:hypothetical protein
VHVGFRRLAPLDVPIADKSEIDGELRASRCVMRFCDEPVSPSPEKRCPAPGQARRISG